MADTAVPAAPPKTADPAHDEPHHKIGLKLYTQPVQRQKWGDTQVHPVVNWGDLFFDLFYVGAAYNLGYILFESPTNRGILYFVGCYFPVMMLWFDKMYYDSRFYTYDDVWHRTFEVSVLVVLATAVLHIRPEDILSNPSENVDMFAFCLALVLGSFLTVIRYVEILIGVDGEPVAKVAAKRDILSRMVSTLWFIAATIVAGIEFYAQDDDDHDDHLDDDHRLLAEEPAKYKDEDSSTNDVPIYLLIGGVGTWILWQFMMIVVCFPGGGKHKEITVPMNIDFAIHRYGEWAMLMLGESVLSLLIVDTSEGVDYYITFYAGILSVILLQYMHFRSQPHHADGHAMRRSKNRGILFSYLIQIYSAALIVVGVSYKLLLSEYTLAEDDGGDKRRMLFGPMHHRMLAGGGGASKFSTEDRQQRIANLFCGSMAVVWFTSDLMILTHKGLKDNAGRCRCKVTHKANVIGVMLVILRVGLVAFIATLSQYETDPEHVAVIGLAGIVAQVILRVLGNFIFPDYSVHASGESHGGHEEEDPEEEKWPNVTHARAEPAHEKSAQDGE